MTIRNESSEHVFAKLQLFDMLKTHPRVSKLQLERDLKTVRPDISLYIGDVPVAIELQRSQLTVDAIKHRFEQYTQKRICLLWISLVGIPSGKDNWFPKWERFLCGMYFGEMYYWRDTGQVVAVKSKPKVAEYDSEYYGITRRTLKRTRDCGQPVECNIVNDFSKQFRQEFYDYPSAYLWRRCE